MPRRPKQASDDAASTPDLFDAQDGIQVPTQLTVDPQADSLTIADFAERAYLDYAVSVVKGRALPDVCDGMKPVQRRILYAMHRMALAVSAKPVKSARVVGDVLGKYHPHGDQSAYDALVRLAQGFALRYPLIDGQGNFGSRDGDGAAAMRYTEARLTAFASLLLDEIDEGTVDFGPNYDGSFTEPLRLPARLPVAILNGASGIAVGMATEIPPHHLGEVGVAAIALIERPEMSDAEFLGMIPGPDFPGGGQIISSQADIAQAYTSGRGSLKIRARWVIEELARGQWQLVVQELPHGVSSQRVLEDIEEITNPKIRAGKKSLSAEQQQLRTLMLGVLDTVRDESGKDAAVRLVFEPRSSRQDRDEFARVLLAHTPLETSVSMNLVAVDLHGRPRSLSLREMLSQWVDYRIATVRRRSEHRLELARRRIHILEGRMLALLRIDEVIAVIRHEDEPKPALMERFGLSELQADDILDIRLRQLARLEAIRIDKELSQLRETEDKLARMLGSERSLRRHVSREIEADVRLYGDARRTLIKAAERTIVEVPLADEPVTAIVSTNGWLRARQGHGHDPLQFTFKTGDALYAAFECRTVDHLVALSSAGRCFSVPMASLPGARGDGAPMTSMVELESGSVLTHFAAAESGRRVLLVSRMGQGFVTGFDAMISRQRSGKQFMTLDEGDAPAVLRVLSADAQYVALLTMSGGLLLLGLDEIKQLATGGRGVSLVTVDAAEAAIRDAIGLGPRDALVVSGTGRGGKSRAQTLDPKTWRGLVVRRGRKARPPGLSFRPEQMGLVPGA